jgi:hypothetical protein
MRKLTLAAMAATLLTPAAHAATVTISGTPGAGSVTVAFGGTAQVRGNGSLQAPSAAAFDNTRDLQFLGFLANSAIQDTIAPLTGTLAISNGVTSAGIDALFLDDDVDDQDDLGFRSTAGLVYSVGQVLTFSGTGTMAFDIGDFGPVSGLIASFNAQSFIARDQIQLSVVVLDDPVPVPVPPALPLLGAGAVALGLMARRRKVR